MKGNAQNAKSVHASEAFNKDILEFIDAVITQEDSKVQDFQHLEVVVRNDVLPDRVAALEDTVFVFKVVGLIDFLDVLEL